ncbi:MAG: hypothetical protein E6Q06_02540 [Candidatus Moraniibacteriota bacterium]|nr:MAG: hypothetical protein E6Q06_02540 [Candidatus Moranbacteria bacterium]
MSLVFQRCLLIFVVALVQRSFFDILWPDFEVPSLVVSAIVAETFILGFSTSIKWVILLIFFHSMLGADSADSLFPVAAVMVAYVTSFLSRRLRIERPVQSSCILAIVSAIAVLALQLFLFITQGIQTSLSIVFGNAFLALLLLPIMFIIFRSHDEYIRTSLMSDFRSLRT